MGTKGKPLRQCWRWSMRTPSHDKQPAPCPQTYTVATSDFLTPSVSFQGFTQLRTWFCAKAKNPKVFDGLISTFKACQHVSFSLQLWKVRIYKWSYLYSEGFSLSHSKFRWLMQKVALISIRNKYAINRDWFCSSCLKLQGKCCVVLQLSEALDVWHWHKCVIATFKVTKCNTAAFHLVLSPFCVSLFSPTLKPENSHSRPHELSSVTQGTNPHTSYEL